MATKKTGMIAGAHPTAPGGMSEKALVAELVEKHGFDRGALSSTSWPEKIDLVIQERRNRETEQAAVCPLGLEGHYLCDCPPAEAVEFVEGVDFNEVALPPAPLFLPDPHTKDFVFDGHAGTGPSGAERWMNCTASLAATRAFLETLTPNQQVGFASGSTAARQGTTAHAAAEAEARVILGTLDSEELDSVLMELTITPPVEGEAYDDEMAEYITEYTDLVQIYTQERGVENVLIEARVEATIPLMTVDADGEQETYVIPGSVDCGVLPTEDHPTLVAADLKYGEGLNVDVEENPQVRIYALGLLERIADEDTGQLPEWLTDVEYVIVQPRLGGIKVWTESVDALLDWRDEVLSPALTEALGGMKAGAKFVPSDLTCQWCPVRGNCAALAEQRVEAAKELFDVIQDAEFTEGPGAFPETGALTSDQLAALYTQIRGLTKIQSALKEELERRLHRGTDVPGYHLVNYQPPRHWAEDAPVEKMLTIDKLRKPAELISPTVAEKTLGEDFAKIQKWVVKPDKRPVGAPVDDRRSAWQGKPPEAMFDDEGAVS
jgi:hypothetical protein